MWLTKLAAFSLLTLTAYGQAEPRFRLSKAGVIILAVTDLNRSVAFYRDRLGLKMTSTNEEFAFFNAGGITIALRGGQPKVAGAALLATEISFEVDHVKPAYQALKTLGLEFKREPRNVTGTTWATDFRDPDGHVLSIVGPE
jgi:catechol 2,3-dioxygenase-like lactoylglutathione lyase family enzyme